MKRGKTGVAGYGILVLFLAIALIPLTSADSPDRDKVCVLEHTCMSLTQAIYNAHDDLDIGDDIPWDDDEDLEDEIWWYDTEDSEDIVEAFNDSLCLDTFDGDIYSSSDVEYENLCPRGTVEGPSTVEVTGNIYFTFGEINNPFSGVVVEAEFDMGEGDIITRDTITYEGGFYSLSIEADPDDVESIDVDVYHPDIEVCSTDEPHTIDDVGAINEYDEVLSGSDCLEDGDPGDIGIEQIEIRGTVLFGDEDYQESAAPGVVVTATFVVDDEERTFEDNTGETGSYSISFEDQNVPYNKVDSVELHFDGEEHYECSKDVILRDLEEPVTTYNPVLEDCDVDIGEDDEPVIPGEPEEPDVTECTPGDPPSFPEGQTCESLGFNFGELECQEQDDGSGKIDPSGCFNCPEDDDPNLCRQGHYMCQECGDVCGEDPYCEYVECDDEFEVSLTASLGFEEDEEDPYARLDWNTDGTCAVDTYDIYVKTDEDKDFPMDPKFRIVYGDKFSYRDDNLELNKTHTYRIEAIKNDEKEAYDEATVTAPDEICLENQFDGSFCYRDDDGDSQLVRCDYGQASSQSCESCVHDDGEPQCIDVDTSEVTCSYGSGPFGLFGYREGLVRYDGVLEELEELEEADGTRDTLDLLISLNICYYDEFSSASTTVGEVKRCEDVNTCYDYAMQDSCIDNDCGIPQDCEWEDYSEELGIGVCRPTEGSEQSFEMCSENELFDGNCNEPFCELHAEGDFYAAGDSNICTSTDNLACSDYQTKKDCEGEERPFTANIPGNNSQTLSDDAEGLGKCFWAEEGDIGGCFRDARHQREEEDPEQYANLDCHSDDRQCMTAFENPITNITVHNTGENFSEGKNYSQEQIENLIVSVEDEDYPSGQVNTYFGLTTEENEDYLDVEFQQYFDKAIRSLSNPGKYTLAYYSVDPANNHEEVQSVTFDLMEGLNISELFDYDLSKGQDEIEDGFNYYTNISMTMDQDDVETLVCDYELISQTDGEVYDSIESSGQEENTFNYVRDDTYDLKVECEESETRRSGTHEDELILDSIDAINNVSPRVEAFNGEEPIDLYLETNASANCSYKSLFEDEEDYTRLESEKDGTVHTGSIEIEDPGIYVYETKCTFDERVFEGHRPHMFIFTLDNLPPNINILHEGEEYEPEEPVRNEISLELICDNDHPVLLQRGTNTGFECDTVEYCVYDALTESKRDCELEELPEDGFVDIIADEEVLEQDTLVINATDTGGNEEELEQLVDVRRFDMDDPIARVYRFSLFE